MKLHLLTLLALTTTSSLTAQKQKVRFGIEAGINVANMNYQWGIDLNTSSTNGFVGYVFADLPVYKQFSVQTEIGYCSFGTVFFREFISSGQPIIVQTHKINYLNIALLPKIKIRNTGLSFYIGPSLAVKLNSDVNGEFYNGTVADFIAMDPAILPSDYKSIDVFAIGGIEYYFPIGFGFSTRFMRGLTNIAEIQSPHIASTNTTARNYSFVFTIGYRFK